MKTLLIILTLVGSAALADDSDSVTPDKDSGSRGSGIPMYPKSSCVGVAIMGKCNGAILHPGPPPKRCYGTMLNGKCVGPSF